MINKIEDLKLAIIGLGYVGLPLALEFAKKKNVIGFDIDKKRISELKSGIDKNLEFKKEELKKAQKLHLTFNIEDLKSVNCYIITVPTPIDKFKKPDLKPLFEASEIVSKFLDKKDLIIYESTVYPGCIEEECVPIIEKFSNLKFNQDFFCGYSPERVNPGDKLHTISNIKKITSGSNPEVANLVDNLYKNIITAGTHKAPSIKVAEAAKVIENTQRDLNIALINELSILFNKLNINTQAVLNAAESKWNFLPFKPGLVGGHCIGVDPYYLTYKAEILGHYPKVVLAGRQINDEMIFWIFDQLLEMMREKNIDLDKASLLVLGISFKENCVDIRNSKVLDLISKFKQYKISFDVYDPVVNKSDLKEQYNINLLESLKTNKKYNVVILCVAHSQFCILNKKQWLNLIKEKGFFMDLKGIIPRELNAYRL